MVRTYFRLQKIRLFSINQIEIVKGENARFSQLKHYCSMMFEAEENEKIRSLLSKPVTFKWFTDAFYGDLEESQNYRLISYLHHPRVILECVEEVYDVIKIHEQDLPCYFWVGKDKENSWTDSLPVYYDNRRFSITTDWNYCKANWWKDRESSMKNEEGDEIIDLSNMTEFKCNDCLDIKNDEGKWERTMGSEIIVRIQKLSFLEYHKNTLDEMIEFCRSAEKNNYLVLPSIK